jgi:hypothetical protein
MFILNGHADLFVPHVPYCFGQHWNWSDVTITPQGVKVFGAEYIGGPKIEFTEQIGVYFLGNDEDLLACQGWINKSLGETLETHAPEFFSGKYDKFTWIGFRPVFQGKLDLLPAFNPMYQQPLSLILIKAFTPFEDMLDGEKKSTAHLIMTEYIQAK